MRERKVITVLFADLAGYTALGVALTASDPAGAGDRLRQALAPLFAAAFATHDSFDTFLVGLAASIGAGISMGFAEALSDDGSLTGRGHPWIRGLVCGAMTALGGPAGWFGWGARVLGGDFDWEFLKKSSR